MKYTFPVLPLPAISVANSEEFFPVHRVYCVGRNYPAHAREMGSNPEREPPFFFTKPADAVVPSGSKITYPPQTLNFQHEIELVVAIGKEGSDISQGAALDHVFGYGVGIDLTRRDLQFALRDKGRPWDVAKGFDDSAPCTALHKVEEGGHFNKGAIWLKANGVLKQSGDLSEMIWSVSETISILSQFFKLKPGDLIYTGTPAGVGPISRGDWVEGGIDGLGNIEIQIV